MAITVESSGQVVVPVSVRRRAGIKAGDRLEFEASSGMITIRKKPVEEDEYTPAGRRIIQKRLAQAAEDLNQGRVYGPFDTIGELERSLREVGAASAAKRKTKMRK